MKPFNTAAARRLGWFALIWIASVAGLSVVAYAIRWALMPA